MRLKILPSFFLRALLPFVLGAQLIAADAAPQNTAPKPSRIKVPPSADLVYSIKARQSGIELGGESVLRWNAGGGKYSLVNETRAMLFGKIHEVNSEGMITPQGLAPTRFTEKRFRKEPTTTSFDRATKTIRFSASEQTYPIKGGEQDRSSVIWQLISMARAAPEKFKPGAEWRVFVAGQRDAEPWFFKAQTQEKIKTPLGELNTVHISRAPPPDSKDQRLDIWLAPSLEWYPVRLRFSETEGDYIEQTLTEARRKTP